MVKASTWWKTLYLVPSALCNTISCAIFKIAFIKVRVSYKMPILF